VPVRRIGVVNTRAAKEVILARETTEITAKIQAYDAGEMSRAELVQYLAHEHQYAPAQDNPYPVMTPEGWDWAENNDYQPGTYDEVLLARDTGLLDWDTVHAVNDELHRRAQRERGTYTEG
jgi:hypothetical protein